MKIVMLDRSGGWCLFTTIRVESGGRRESRGQGLVRVGCGEGCEVRTGRSASAKAGFYFFRNRPRRLSTAGGCAM